MKLNFPYNPALIEKIKTIPTRTWLPDEKAWEVSDEFADLAISHIRGFYPEIANGLSNLTEQTKGTSAALLELGGAASVSDLTDPDTITYVNDIRNSLSLPYDLFPYQELCVAYMEEVYKEGKGVLIADEMGLGKTIETIAWLSMHKEIRPAMIICPASVKQNWYREIKKWIPDADVQLIRNGKDEFELDKDFYVINYDLIWRMEDIDKINIESIVFDEVTAIKESKAKRSKTAKVLGRKAKYIIGLSGTPIMNRPIEFYNFLNMISPKRFNNWVYFGTRYCGGRQIRVGKRQIWQFSGATNLDELGKRLKSLMLRRKKSQVLTELPEKRRQNIYLELPSKYRKEYIKTEKDLVWSLEQVKSNRNLQIPDVLAKLGLLRHTIGMAKVDLAGNYIKQVVEGDNKLVVFAHHRDVLDKLEETVRQAKIKYVRADGSTANENRQKYIDIFQEDENCMVFLASSAMGMGVTLTAASNALFVERQWSPALEEQMEDRVHRIGQNNGVLIQYMQVEKTFDEKMAKVIDSKREIMQQVLDSNFENTRVDTEESAIDEVLKSYQ